MYSCTRLHDDHIRDPDGLDIPETDFRQGVRNPYLVSLAPDAWRLFPTADAVNAALRAYAAEHNLDGPAAPSHREVMRRLAAAQSAAAGPAAARP